MNGEIKTMKEKLTEQVRLAVSVIGAGNAGGQVVNALYGSFPVFAINSSQKDLDATVISDKVAAFIIGDEARGAGKSRDVAKALLKKNGRDLFKTEAFTSMIEDSDVVIVTGAMAGGTGSGIAPVLLAMLTEMYPKKIFIYFGILPKVSDSYQAQSNTLQCYSEITGLNIPYMLADLDHFRDVSNDVAYAQIAAHIKQSIETLSGEYLNYSASGMIDENDMRVIISEPGYMSVYTLDAMSQADIDTKPIQERFVDLVKSSPAAPIQRDGAVRQMGMIVSCPEDLMESMKSGNYSGITDYVGKPFGVFENYEVNNGSLARFIMILSGMSDPDSRILMAKNVVDKERPKERKTSSVLGDTSKYGTSANVDKLLTGGGKTEETDKENVLDKFF